ncbi:ionotropic receptor 93a isoform X1 [Harmonia axyridis]|uniref:ionotropic receptor 93a isoform X1 n=1 Tax=Harmonia axyridis TaxID=115357 RepID=UPI001E275C54|nr:ionotropic receptor 93a isoform X1 [Harmonia axyridis]
MVFPLYNFLIYVFIVMCNRTDSSAFPIPDNSLLAIVVDEEFVTTEFKNAKATIEDFEKIVTQLNIKENHIRIGYYTSMGFKFKRDISGILAITSCKNTWKVYDRADGEFIPFIALSEVDCPRLPAGKAINIPLTKLGEEMSQILLDLRTSTIFKWKSVVLIYDSSMARDMVSRITASLTDDLPITTQSTAFSLIKLNDTQFNSKKNSLVDQLTSISMKKTELNFLVVTHRRVVEKVMAAAELTNLVNTETQWLYAIPDTSRGVKKNMKKLRKSLREGSNVGVIYNNTETDSGCVGGLLCHFRTLVAGFSTALYETMRNELDLADQVSGEEWEAIRPTKSERRTYLLEKVLGYLRKNGKCDNCTNWIFRAADSWGNNFNADANDTSIQLGKVGSWTPIMGAEMSDELFLHVAHGFRKKKLKLVTVHNPPWQIISVGDAKTEPKHRGLTFDIINHLARKLNFTYSVHVLSIENKNEQTSSNLQLDTNDTSTPTDVEELTNFVTNWIPPVMIDMVKNGNVAFAAYGATITEKYQVEIDFTNPISVQSYTFLVARPKELSRALLFMAPFSGDTWLCLLIAIFSVGPILYCIHKISPMPEQRERAGGLFSIQNCIWYMYGALLQQGGMHLPQADSARILVGSWWLVVLVIATTYCGNLVAFLTFPEMEKPLTTIDALLNKEGKISWSMVEGSYIEEELQNLGDSRFKVLYTLRVKNQTRDKILEEVSKGKQVFIDWKLHLQYLMRNEYIRNNRCEYALATDEFFPERIGLIISKKNPYLFRINKGIKELHQFGLIHKWLKEYLPKKEKCWKSGQGSQANNHIVNMDDMQGSFFVLFLGFLLALLFIFVERVWFRQKTKRKVKSIVPYTK